MKSLSLFTMALVLAVSFAGCSVSLSIPVRKGIVLPGTGVESSALALEEVTKAWDGMAMPFSLGEICAFSSINALIDFISSEAGSQAVGIDPALLRRIKIMCMTPNKVEFIAREGDFSTLTKVNLDMRVEGESKVVYEAASPSGFGQVIDAPALKKYNLMNLFNNPDINCIEHFLSVEGVPAEEDVVFDLWVHVRIYYRLRLF